DLVPQNGLNLGLGRSRRDNTRLANGMSVQPPRRRGRGDPALTDLVAAVHGCVVMIAYTLDDLTLLTPRLRAGAVPQPPDRVAAPLNLGLVDEIGRDRPARRLVRLHGYT